MIQYIGSDAPGIVTENPKCSGFYAVAGFGVIARLFIGFIFKAMKRGAQILTE
jgi:hypothetical protein